MPGVSEAAHIGPISARMTWAARVLTPGMGGQQFQLAAVRDEHSVDVLVEPVHHRGGGVDPVEHRRGPGRRGGR